MNDNITTKVSDGPSDPQSETETPEARSLHRMVRRLCVRLQHGLRMAGVEATLYTRSADVSVRIGDAFLKLKSTDATDDPDWLICARRPVGLSRGREMMPDVSVVV